MSALGVDNVSSVMEPDTAVGESDSVPGCETFCGCTVTIGRCVWDGELSISSLRECRISCSSQKELVDELGFGIAICPMELG